MYYLGQILPQHYPTCTFVHFIEIWDLDFPVIQMRFRVLDL